MLQILQFDLDGQKLTKSAGFPDIVEKSNKYLKMVVSGIPEGFFATAYFILSWETTSVYNIVLDSGECYIDEYLTTLPENPSEYFDYTISVSIAAVNSEGIRITSNPETIKIVKSNFSSETTNTPEIPKSQYDEYVYIVTQEAERAEKAVENIEGAEEKAQNALEIAEQAKERADSAKGVYVGEGDMPDGYDLQIDPTGEALLVDNEMSDTSENVPKTKVVKAYADETAKELRVYVDETADELLNRVYPVGSIYMSVNATEPFALFGGTWKQLKDRFLLGAGDSYAAGETGGEATHMLTTAEMPTHSHGIKQHTTSTSGIAGVTRAIASDSVVDADYTWRASAVAPSGDSVAHNNMPPYLAVYMWQRVA